MIPRSTDPKGKAYGRSFPFSGSGDKAQPQSGQGRGQTEQNDGAYMPKAPQPISRTSSKAPPLPMPDEPLPMTPYEQQTMSKKVFEALSDDVDPSKALADIRRLLVGPAAQLHEARMEEVISILEESDRNHQASIATLEQRCHELSMMAERLLSSNEEAHGKIQSQTDYFSSEIQKSNKMQQDKLSELFVMIDNKLQKMSSEMHQLVDTLAAKTGSDYQALANDVIGRVQQLSASTASNHDKLVSHMENRLAQAESVSEQDKRKQLDVFAEGFADLADRLLALRKQN
jgi:Skp family chaperone for outer membrane proteins